MKSLSFIRSFKSLFYIRDSQSTDESLEELINQNLEGRNRLRTINQLRKSIVVLGTKQNVNSTEISSKDVITYLTSSSPDNSGEVLLAFVDDISMSKRNPAANPMNVDFEALMAILNSSSLNGVVIITRLAWTGFKKEELKST
ncbi:MAG: hypothetical protein JKY02_09140 [Flavobacteriaceae bacterium]|nr:hypothetical protein [Flavobacteriaceae bacterium]